MEEQIQIQTAKTELSRLSIKDLFYKYIRFLPLFIVSVALALLIAWVYLRYSTLIYQSSGVLIIQDESSSSGGGDKLDDLFAPNNKKNIQNEIEYIKSKKMMTRVVKSLDLNFTYYAKGNIKELNVYKSCPFRVVPLQINDSAGFALKINFKNENNFFVNGEEQPFAFGQVFEIKSGVFKLERTSPNPPGNEYKVVWQPTDAVAGGLSNAIIVAPKQGTGIVTLNLESPNPDLAADVINSVMDEYQKATVEDKNAKTKQELVFVDKELDTVSHQLDSISSVYVNFIKQNSAYDLPAQSTSYLKQIEDGTTNRTEQLDMLNRAYQIENDLLSKNQTVKVPSSLGIEDPTLNKMVDAYNEAQLQKKALLQTTLPGNPAVQQQEQVINQLQKNILSSLANIKTSLKAGIGSIDHLTGSAQFSLKLLPEKQKILTEIERQAQSKVAVYNNLLAKKEQSAIELAATISNIKVLQDAAADYTPIKPNKRNVRVLAVLIGLVLPALFIFVLELLNDKVSTRYDIERLTAATILGEVGHSYGKSSLVVTNNNRSVVAEQFRIIRSNLQYVLNHVQKPVILVTSSFSGEGKSFVSTNVGAVMALAGKKTIILEFDIRKPKILAHLNIPKKQGLTNYILGKTKLEELPVKVEGIENLYVLPCGPIPPNPAELLLDSKLSELFQWLRENFDTVVMDTAPVGMVSDAMTLSKFANCTLYIVRQGHTYKKQIGMIDEFYTQEKLPKISIILNDVKIRSGYGYYGYGRYGYGYGYGSGYFDEETPPAGLLGKWFGWMDTKKWTKKKRKKAKL